MAQKKKLNSDAMSSLLNGLTKSPAASAPSMPTPHSSSPTPVRGRPRSNSEHVCLSLRKDYMAKVRILSEKEGIAIKDVFNTLLERFIERYEGRYGEIRPVERTSHRLDDIM